MSSPPSSRSSKGKNNNSKSNKDQTPALQLIIREKSGWRLMKQDRKSGKLQQQSPIKACHDADIVFSDDGVYFAVLLDEGMEIYESSAGRKLCFLAHNRVRHVYFSPSNTYIVSYHHRRAQDKHGNCWVWKWDPSSSSSSSSSPANDEASNANNEGQNEGQTEGDEQKSNAKGSRVVFQFFLPEFEKKRRPLQFSDDEIIAARITKNAVLVHDARRLHYKSNNIIGKFDVVNVASVVVAPCQSKSSSRDASSSSPSSPTASSSQNSYLLAVFALPKNNKAATTTIYEYQYALAMNKKSSTNKLFTKIAQRAFFGADQCELLWDSTNAYHHNLLAIASSDVDTSGKSYYGNQTLYLLSSRNNFTAKVDISDNGKLQDVAWHPGGKEFVMIDDHPQKITICDFRGQKAHALGQFARNLIRFSGDGRFLWCGGFGNLTGEMTFYDYQNVKNESLACLGYQTDDACRYFEWSPDATSFVTARLYPYMTVDNGFRIYKYNGQRLYEENVERLYQIAYRPNAKGTYPPRSVSPAARKKAKLIPKSQAKKRYVPPHMRSADAKEKVADAPPVAAARPSAAAASSASGPSQSSNNQRQPRPQQPRPQQPRQQPQRQQQQQQQQPPRQQQPSHQNPTHASQAQYQNHTYQQQQQRQSYQPPPHQAPYQQQQQQYGGQQEYYGQPPMASHAAPAYNNGNSGGSQPHAQSYPQQQPQQPAKVANTEPVQQPGQGQPLPEPGQAADAENGAVGDGTKKRRRGKKNKKAGANLVNTTAVTTTTTTTTTASSSSQSKPGLHDNKRWARGSKYTE